MATKILSSSFEDIYGNVTTFYRGNVDDLITATFVVENAIEEKSTDTNYFYVDIDQNEISRLSGDWEDFSFRVGQSIEVRNPSIATFTATILYITGNVMGLSTIGTLAPSQSFGTLDWLKLTATNNHDSLDLLVNFIANGSGLNTSSLIDGENTILRFNGLDALSVAGSVSSIQVGHKSGQFDISGEIIFNSVASHVRNYTLTFNSFQGGAYLDSSFIGSECLKLVAQMQFKVVEGEPSGNPIVTYNESADTGYLNQAFNTGIVNATIVDGINTIDYRNPTTAEFTIDSSAANRHLGALYIPLDGVYYKNNDFSQSIHSMQLNAHLPYVDDTYSSALNNVGAGYDIEIIELGTIGTETTYEITFTPNSDFTAFMDGREDGDRRLVIYFNCGTVNLIVFDGQLTKEPLVAGVLPNVTSHDIIFHNNNTQDTTGLVLTPISTYTEDDLGCIIKFRPEKEAVYTRLVCRVEIHSLVNGDKFTLEQAIFDFNNVQVSTDGIYLLNESIGVTNNLPSSSAKKVATLVRYPSIDVGTTYGVKLYYPFINRWEYWLQQANADVAFYPNQNKDWFHYANDADWNIRIVTSLENDEQAFIFNKGFSITDYDSGNLTTTIEYFRENGDPCSAIVDGEIMTIKATHTGTTPLNIDNCWGWIKVEPFESQPYWVNSSVIGNGNDVNNPLYDLTMTTLLNSVILECKYNTNQMSIENGVSVSSRAFGNDIFPDYWETTDGGFFTDDSGDKWTLTN